MQIAFDKTAQKKEWNFKISRFSADIVEFKILKFLLPPSKTEF